MRFSVYVSAYQSWERCYIYRQCANALSLPFAALLAVAAVSDGAHEADGA